MAIGFNQIGSFNGINGGADVLDNPTSLQFGPDGRLYVAEQNGTINAFTLTLQDGEYIATAHEELLLPDGSGIVQSIQNHNDDGSLSGESDRQVTGLVVTGTAENPVLYISSSDPRIATFNDSNLDTNSGVVTQVTWTGTEWEAVDIIRGLPRSEENHSVNGLELSPDGTKLYLTVGGNTNNGAPSNFFAYTGEYALSGTVLEIDLSAIANLPILTDPAGGQNGTSRQYIYDLPTLDDPTVSNVTDGVGEDAFGMDESGPWGGNDGFNQAILPADAPLRIYADGLRNSYDLVLTESGQLYTVDNGSNGDLGGDPISVNGEATNQPNNGGTGDPEPLFLIQDGGYYGHPAPARSNQDLSWTVYDDSGNPDPSLPINSIPNLADLVPDGVNIAEGFIIDPSKFTGDPARLTESGIRIERDSTQSNALVTLGSSSNGLVEYTSDAFDGALQGALIVAQFNGSVTLLNLSEDGTTLEPLIDPSDDGLLGTADDQVIDADGVYPLITGQSLPLDVTIGPDGTIWVAELGAGNINVFAPSDLVLPDDPDADDDGILNVDDPFLRDATNGGSVLVFPEQTLLWDFDANQDGNLPGPSGYGGGLTGVMIDGSTDFEQFFLEPSTLPGQLTKLDNVKFITAAGGGTTVIEFVSNGDPLAGSNTGEYLFHTGVTIAPTVDTFTVKWSIFNPATELTGPFQQIGGYIGTGDQSNYLKIVATQDPNGEIQIVLEDNDVVIASSFIQADGLFDVPPDQQIFFELEIDPTAETATPTISYQTGDGAPPTVSGPPLSLSGTTVLDAILGQYTVNGQTTGLAVGLLSSNTGQPEASTFQAIFNDIEITATGDTTKTVLYRVNAGGPEIAAIDGGIVWSADTASTNSQFLTNSGSNGTATFPAVEPGATVPVTTPGEIFDTERWDLAGGSEMQWAFDVPEAGLYEVRLYVGNGYDGTNDPGERVFDVAVEGSVPSSFDNIDLSNQFGHEVGGVLNTTVQVTDGTLDLEFLHGIENPLINGIEIIQIGSGTPSLSLTIDPMSISENSGVATATVTRSGDTTDALTVALTSSDTSEATVAPTVEILAGQDSATFQIAAVDDAILDGTQTPTITASANGFSNGTATLAVTDDETGNSTETVLYRVNAGGPEIAAIDGGIVWSADTASTNSQFLTNSGSNGTATFPAVEPGATVPVTTPGEIFDTERWDLAGGSEMQWAFDVPEAGLYEVRLYVGNGYDGTNDPGERVFDVAVEGSVPSSFDNIDLSNQFGHEVGGVLNTTVQVTDGTLDLEFLHGIENPLINGIEIIQLGDAPPITPTISIVGGPYTVGEGDGQVQVSLLSDVTVPSDESVDVTFEIVPGTATPQADYDYPSTTATFNSQTGIYTDTVTIAGGSSDVTVLIDILPDALEETNEGFTVNITDVSPNAQIGTNTAAVTIQDDNPLLLFSLNQDTTVDGLSVANEDIVSFDGTTFTTFFDGSDVGLESLTLDAFNAISDTEILMSFSQAATINGAGTVDDSDIVKFTATSLGDTTAGTFELYFDGSDVGLTNNGEDIDAVQLLDDGRILISTRRGVSVSGVSAMDEDLLVFEPSSLGVNTSGTWALYFDGSDVGLADSNCEDINAVAIDNGNFLFSTVGNVAVPGVSGADEDILSFTPSSLGNTTAGSYDSTLFFNGNEVGITQDLWAIDIFEGPLPG